MALMTPAQISDRIYEERAYFTSDRDRATHELADSLTPVYYGDIIEEWRELPSEFSDAWQELGATKDATISSLMTTDLWLYYRAQIERALDEIHLCETELMPEISISPSGTMAVCECGYKCAHWECACELNDHDHPTETN